MIRLVTAAVAVMVATGCGSAGDENLDVPQAVQAIGLTETARKDAAIEAATQHFNQTVRTPFLVEQGLSVRGLARAVTKAPRSAKPGSAADLQPSQYDQTADSSSKLELVNGKVVYTAIASVSDPSAAVIIDGNARWVVAYEIEAQLTPEGELKNFEFHQLGQGRRSTN
jgi:hypothetical protein